MSLLNQINVPIAKIRRTIHAITITITVTLDAVILNEGTSDLLIGTKNPPSDSFSIHRFTSKSFPLSVNAANLVEPITIILIH